MPIKKQPPSKLTAVSKLDKMLPWLLIVAGIIGLAASFVLMMDKIAILKDPSYQPSCNINPIIACGSVIVTSQANAFGFPNPIIGLIGFSVLITVGVTWLSGVRSQKAWYWRTFLSATLLATVFIHWLMFQTIYRIEALCPYCMIVWVVTIATFWYSLLWTIRRKYLRVPAFLNKLVAFANQNHLGVLIVWYLAIMGLILNHFWYYFGG